VKDSLDNDYPVTGACCNNGVDYSAVDIIPGHAYTIIGYDEVTIDSSTVKLIWVRNPHGDKTFTGYWSGDDSVNWNSDTKS